MHLPKGLDYIFFMSEDPEKKVPYPIRTSKGVVHKTQRRENLLPGGIGQGNIISLRKIKDLHETFGLFPKETLVIIRDT
jgi:hypothetical protein